MRGPHPDPLSFIRPPPVFTLSSPIPGVELLVPWCGVAHAAALSLHREGKHHLVIPPEPFEEGTCHVQLLRFAGVR